MADRFPLIANPSTRQIEELVSYDNLNLTNSGIVGATTIRANLFIGNLTGTATTSTVLTNASNVLSGTLPAERLSGYYNIGVNTANILTDGSNILSGTISSQRLSGTYGINVTGTSNTAYNLENAANINDGIISAERLSGTYNINITGSAFETVGAALSAIITSTDDNNIQYLTFVPKADIAASLFVDKTSLVYNPSSNRLGIGSTSPRSELDVVGTIRVSDGIIIGDNSFSQDIIISGIASATGGLFKTLNVTQQSTLNNVSITGVATIGQITLSSTNSRIVANSIDTDNLRAVGISTFNNISIGATEVLSSTRELKNILSIDAITTETFKTFLKVGFFETLEATGVGTIVGKVVVTNGVDVKNQSIAEDLSVTGVSTFVNGPVYIGSGTSTGTTNQKLQVNSGAYVSGNVGLGTTLATSKLSVEGDVKVSGVVTAVSYFGDGSTLSGIVTSLIAGIGISLSPPNGKGSVTVTSYKPIGKTIYVSQNGSDDNTGLAENYPKRTIKAAAELADLGDTIKVFPGAYIENNPVILKKQVSVEGTELRNCIITPQNPGLDLFHVNNGCHLTDLSFIGQQSTNGAAIVAFQPLAGVASDRFFDAARMIRYNLDFIASEAVGYLTSTDYRSPAFSLNSSDYSSCRDDIKDVLRAICYDITRGGNTKCVGAGKSYYSGETLQHIVGVKTETIDAIRYAAGIAVSCINNVDWQENYQHNFYQVKDVDIQYDPVTGSNQNINSCANVVSAIYSCAGIVTTIINQSPSVLGVGINTVYPGNAGLGTTNPNDPSFSPGVGPITQGPYVRNCTNFIPKSIGMKVNGFDAEPGDQIDIGVTGSMSVDSYTQYNQGGIGVSVTNGAYAQLVSIFGICNEIAIYSSSGGQLDLTNSCSSFGTYGLVAEGVGDKNTKSIYRFTGSANTDAQRGQNVIELAGVGSYRPYDGQALYFGTLYNNIQTIEVTDGGSGYISPPRVTIDAPSGPNGITAQATTTLVNGSVTAVNVITSGTQYETLPNVTIAPPPIGGGTTATAVVAEVAPIYYTVQSATLPSGGISTVSLAQNLNNTVSTGTTVYISRLSLQLTSSHAFEFIGAGNTIEGARPAQGGVTIQENEVVQRDGGLVIYTSTDQAGNFRIGDGVVINQATGNISGVDFTKALFTTITPFILALTE